MFENVVVGVRADEAGRDAIALAKQLVSPRGEVTLLHVYAVWSKPSPDSAAVTAERKRRYALGRLTALAGEFQIDAEVEWVEARSVRRGLQEFAAARRADLLVLCVTHSDELAREFAGDDTREVLDGAPCAVAVAPVGYSATPRAMTRIGVAYDGSAESERALALARSLAAERGAVVSGFEAVQTPIYVRRPGYEEDELEELVEEARGRITALGGLEAGAALGDAVEELTRYARSVDLLVIGSHRYRPIDHFLQDTTTQRLAEEPSTPLLVLSGR